MLGVAAGGDIKQAAAYKKQFRVTFPVVPDEEGEVYYGLGVPTVPFMLVTDTQGKVLMTHTGQISDLDHVLKEIREIHKEQ